MTDESISETPPCLSKTTRGIPPTGNPSAGQSVIGPITDAKEAQRIPTAEPKTDNPTPKPGAVLCSPSPTSTTSPKTVNRKTFDAGISDATSPTMPNTMSKPGGAQNRSQGITAIRPSSSGKTKPPSHKELIRAIQGDELALGMYQIQLEAYKPAMDACKRYLEIYGSGSPNFYMTRNRQVAAVCQMKGMNDPTATRKQRLAAATCYEMIFESIMRGLEMGLDKEQVKKMMNDAIDSAGSFFGFGNKKAVNARKGK